MELLGFLFLGVVGTELSVYLLGTLYGVDDGGKIHQKGIPDAFADRAVMRGDSVLDSLIMHIQQPQGASLVAAHLTAKADDVGEHDRRQPPSLCARCVTGIVLHDVDYSADTAKLSIVRANVCQSPFAARTETFLIHPEPQAGGNTVQWVCVRPAWA